MMRILFTLAILLAFSSAKTQTINTVVGTGVRNYTGDGGPALSACINYPQSVAFDVHGNMYVADDNFVVRKVSPSGIITTFAGKYDSSFSSGYSSGDGGPATGAQFNYPAALATDAAGNVYIADFWNNTIRVVDTLGYIHKFAGYGGLLNAGYWGDGGPAILAGLYTPSGVAADNRGNVYIADNMNNVVRKVNTLGIISTFAGDSAHAFSFFGDGGPATNAGLYLPNGVAADQVGNVYIADGGNSRVRMVDTNGIIHTVAGTSSTGGFSGDGGPATAALLSDVYSVAVDSHGNLYIADLDNQRVRMVNTAGIITTVAGSGPTGYSNGSFGGDGGPGTDALLNLPFGITVDAHDDLYIADFKNNRIRKVNTGTTAVRLITNGTHAIELFPNPNNGTFTVRGTNNDNRSEPVALDISNILGEVVYKNVLPVQNGFIKATINLPNNLPPGIYSAHIFSGTESKYLRFIVQK